MNSVGKGASTRRRIVLLLTACVVVCGEVYGQADNELVAARSWIGRALVVRGFYGANELRYDTAGRVMGTPKVVDWTLAGMDVQAVERKGPDAVELDGVRVAIRYNPENHFFERHPQKDEHMKVTIALAGSGGMEKTLGAIFAVGIDPALQRSMPGYWLHYFQPGAGWMEDTLAGKTVVPLDGGSGVPQDLTPPVAERKVEPKYPAEAERDKVQGTVQMRVAVDEGGVSRHVTVVRPLGYGLDGEAALAMQRWQWRPAMRDGKAVATAFSVGQEFKLISPPR